jgi:hypothetical protein
MSAREPWNVADIQLCVRAVLDDGGVGVHVADCSAFAGGCSDAKRPTCIRRKRRQFP